MTCSLNDAKFLVIVTLEIIQSRWAPRDAKMLHGLIMSAYSISINIHIRNT
jgi:hypothetical protein